MDEPSVELFEKYRRGDDQAAPEIFRRYVGRLTVLARARMAPKIARRIDPEDVVYSAYRSFFVRARKGQFTLERSGDLWRLLVGIVLKKLYHQVARHTAEKRSVDREIPVPAGGDSAWYMFQPADASPTAEQALEMAELLEVFMRGLEPRPRSVLELRLNDLRIDEIAAELRVNEKTVRRILNDLENRLRNMLHGNGGVAATSADDCNETEQEDIARNSSRSIPAPSAGTGTETQGTQSEFPFTDSKASAVPVVSALQQLSDRDFVIELHLGSGGSGRVYRARRKADGQPVAVKMLRKANQQDPAAVARFWDEAQTVARLCHPGIVAVLGFGRTRGGGCFLVQELVDGRDLAEIAASRKIAVAEAVSWVAAAADASGHAHAHGIVHCDLKPANILIERQGVVRVTDFGLAQIILPGTNPRTAIAGTIGFIAPEQIDSSWGQIGPATDIFGLGAVLFALLAGRAPFAGNSIDELLHSLLTNSPAAMLKKERPDVSGELGKFIAACLAPAARNRPQSAVELAARLRVFVSQSEV